MLNPHINGKVDRLKLAISCQTDILQHLDGLAIQIALDTGNALIINIDRAKNMRRLVAPRIKPLALDNKINARNTKIEYAFLRRRGHFAFQPDETFVPVEFFAQPGAGDTGKFGQQFFHRLVDVDNPARLGKQRRHPYVHGHFNAVAIIDHRTRSRYGAAGLPSGRKTGVGNTQLNKSCPDHTKNHNKPEYGDLDARPRHVFAGFAPSFQSDRCISVSTHLNAHCSKSSASLSPIGSMPASSAANRAVSAASLTISGRIGKSAMVPNCSADRVSRPSASE